jgi:hypothetical protein
MLCHVLAVYGGKLTVFFSAIIAAWFFAWFQWSSKTKTVNRLLASHEKHLDIIRKGDLERQEMQRQADLMQRQADLKQKEMQIQADLMQRQADLKQKEMQRQADLERQEMQRQADLKQQEMQRQIDAAQWKADMSQQALNLVYNSEWKTYASILARRSEGSSPEAAPPQPAS